MRTVYLNQSRIHPSALIHDALLRPTRFAAFLEGGRPAIMWAVFTTLLVFGVTAGAIVLSGAIVLRLGFSRQAVTPVLLMESLLGAMISTIPFAVVCYLGNGRGRSPQTALTFAVLRCFIALTPPFAFILAFVLSIPNPPEDPELIAVFLMTMVTIFFGIALGGVLTIMLTLHPRRFESVTLRWVLAVGAMAIGSAVSWSPPLGSSAAVLLAPACIGLAIGVARPFSYLWEAPLSLFLALAGRSIMKPLRAIALHPAHYDDLCLLPLPGLSGLLAQVCIVDCNQGSVWLGRVAQHLGQGGAARSAIERIIREGDYAHCILFHLSAHAEGVTLLRQLAAQSSRPAPLILAYADFTQVDAPEAWPSVITQWRHCFIATAHLPGGAGMLAFLDFSVGVLQADRWDTALTHIRSMTPPEDITSTPINLMLPALQHWTRVEWSTSDTFLRQCSLLIHESWNAYDGWPMILLAAVSEHLRFLAVIEQERMSNEKAA